MSAPVTAQASDDALRRPLGILLAGLLAAALSAVPAIPSVHTVLGVGPFDVACALGAFWFSMIVGALVYRVGPHTRLYRVWDRFESALVQVLVLSLVLRSGRGDSFFWIPAIVHLMILGGYASHPRFNTGLAITMPVLLALAFAVITRDLGAAALSLVIGGLGLYVFWLALSVSRKLASVDAERARLASELAEARVRADRERIARDIHDGIGADLAALDWRLRGLRGASDESTSAAEIDELIARLGQGSAELRTIVWALRTPSRRWNDIVAYLRQRASEVCGDACRLELVDDGDRDGSELAGEEALDVMRSVLELVRNAVRHAGATRIRVVLWREPGTVGVHVDDDGRGLPSDVLDHVHDRHEGGLANVRHRAVRAGGELTATNRPEGGASIHVQLFRGADAAARAS